MRVPRFAAARAVFETFAGESEMVVPVVSLPPRLAAQYFFIRSPTALRCAVDMVLRRRRARVMGSSPPVTVDCLVLAALEPFCRSSGKARRIASTSCEISARRAWAPATAKLRMVEDKVVFLIDRSVTPDSAVFRQWHRLSRAFTRRRCKNVKPPASHCPISPMPFYSSKIASVLISTGEEIDRADRTDGAASRV